MKKMTLYPKTNRVPFDRNILITEKIDGENIVFFNFNNIIYIATRNEVFLLNEFLEINGRGRTELCHWIKENRPTLEGIHKGSAICGEFLKRGSQINYSKRNEIKQFHMFAKGRVTFIPNKGLDIEIDSEGNVLSYFEPEQYVEKFEIKELNYNKNLFHFVFKDGVIPDSISVPETIGTFKTVPTVEELDVLYDEFTSKVGKVEGFILVYPDNSIEKYVRLKRGKLKPHEYSKRKK